MSRLLAVIFTITTLIHNTHSEIKSCDSSIDPICGPCIAPDICNLRCNSAQEICADSQLKCGTSNTCQIDCQQPSSCIDAFISAPSSNILTLNCDHSNGCEGTTIDVGNNADFTINCNGIENSCKDSIINAQNAKDVTINCNGEKSCNSMQVNCGSGRCNINCANTAGHVCNGLALTCGTGGQCIIDCSGPMNSYKCSQNSLQTTNTNFAQQFQCIGSATECLGAPMSYINPTKSPTNTPTKSPSINPTNIPTNSPVIPTYKPTTIPTTTPSNNPTNTPTQITTNPTPSPEDVPTKSPTKNPTKFGQTLNSTGGPSFKPSANPSATPTNTATNKPTNNPILKPSANPTATPTYKPSNKPSTNPYALTTLVTSQRTLSDEIYLRNVDKSSPLLNIILVSIIISTLVCGCMIVYVIIKKKGTPKVEPKGTKVRGSKPIVGHKSQNTLSHSISLTGLKSVANWKTNGYHIGLQNVKRW